MDIVATLSEMVIILWLSFPVYILYDGVNVTVVFCYKYSCFPNAMTNHIGSPAGWYSHVKLKHHKKQNQNTFTRTESKLWPPQSPYVPARPPPTRYRLLKSKSTNCHACAFQHVILRFWPTRCCQRTQVLKTAVTD